MKSDVVLIEGKGREMSVKFVMNLINVIE